MSRMRGPIGTASVRTRVSVGVLHWAHQQPLRRLEVLLGSNANPRRHAAPQLRQFEIKQAGHSVLSYSRLASCSPALANNLRNTFTSGYID